jgi:hypothetical protein
MAKWQNDTMLDQSLAWLKTNYDNVYICSSQPTTYSQATSSYKLGTAAATITGSPANGTSSGRKIAVTAKSSIGITSAGKMQHVALVDASPTTLLYVTTIPASSQSSVSASDTVNMAAWDILLKDAA